MKKLSLRTRILASFGNLASGLFDYSARPVLWGLQEAAGKYKDALGKEQAEREELNRQLEQERSNKLRILAEFQSGNSPTLPAITNGAPTATGESNSLAKYSVVGIFSGLSCHTMHILPDSFVPHQPLLMALDLQRCKSDQVRVVHGSCTMDTAPVLCADGALDSKHHCTPVVCTSMCLQSGKLVWLSSLLSPQQ